MEANIQAKKISQVDLIDYASLQDADTKSLTYLLLSYQKDANEKRTNKIVNLETLTDNIANSAQINNKIITINNSLSILNGKVNEISSQAISADEIRTIIEEKISTIVIPEIDLSGIQAEILAKYNELKDLIRYYHPVTYSIEIAGNNLQYVTLSNNNIEGLSLADFPYQITISRKNGYDISNIVPICNDADLYMSGNSDVKSITIANPRSADLYISINNIVPVVYTIFYSGTNVVYSLRPNTVQYGTNAIIMFNVESGYVVEASGISLQNATLSSFSNGNTIVITPNGQGPVSVNVVAVEEHRVDYVFGILYERNVLQYYNLATSNEVQNPYMILYSNKHATPVVATCTLDGIDWIESLQKHTPDTYPIKKNSGISINPEIGETTYLIVAEDFVNESNFMNTQASTFNSPKPYKNKSGELLNIFTGGDIDNPLALGGYRSTPRYPYIWKVDNMRGDGISYYIISYNVYDNTLIFK